MSEPEYRVYALRYAMRDAKRTEHFIGGDPHDATASRWQIGGHHR